MERLEKWCSKKTRADVIKTLKKWNGKLIEFHIQSISSTQLNDD